MLQKKASRNNVINRYNTGKYLKETKLLIKTMKIIRYERHHKKNKTDNSYAITNLKGKKVKIPKICSETIIKIKVQSHGFLGFKSIYSIIFAFSRATRVSFVYLCDIHIMKKTGVSW